MATYSPDLRTADKGSMQPLFTSSWPRATERRRLGTAIGYELELGTKPDCQAPSSHHREEMTSAIL